MHADTKSAMCGRIRETMYSSRIPLPWGESPNEAEPDTCVVPKPKEVVGGPARALPNPKEVGTVLPFE